MSDKAFFRLALVVSIVVFVLVVLLNRRLIPAPEQYPDFVHFLPKLNAIINSICSVLLILSYRAIRRKKVDLHKRLNITTFCLSALFLISYVVFHYFVEEQTYGGTGLISYVYYYFLISHIISAAAVLPLVLVTFHRALNNNIVGHRKIVKFTFPIWLYVTITGVIVYLMISPYYTF